MKRANSSDNSDDESPENIQEIGSDTDAESSIDETELIDVDFEFFNPQENDFHAIKQLLNKQFMSDADDLGMSELVDIILHQGKQHGTTVKVDGEEGDTYSLTTLILPQEKPENTRKCLGRISQFLLRKCEQSKHAKAHGILSKIVETKDKDKGNWGLLVNERLINVPPQIIPPSFKLLTEELQKANIGKELQYIVAISKTFSEAPETPPEDTDARPVLTKRAKKQSTQQSITIPPQFYNAEEEIFAEFSVAQFSYRPSESRSKDAMCVFNDCGIISSRLVSILPADCLPALTKRMHEFVYGPNHDEQESISGK